MHYLNNKIYITYNLLLSRLLRVLRPAGVWCLQHVLFMHFRLNFLWNLSFAPINVYCFHVARCDEISRDIWVFSSVLRCCTRACYLNIIWFIGTKMTQVTQYLYAASPALCQIAPPFVYMFSRWNLADHIVKDLQLLLHELALICSACFALISVARAEQNRSFRARFFVCVISIRLFLFQKNYTSK